jgi:hypothetical protein
MKENNTPVESARQISWPLPSRHAKNLCQTPVITIHRSLCMQFLRMNRRMGHASPANQAHQVVHNHNNSKVVEIASASTTNEQELASADDDTQPPSIRRRDSPSGF